MYPYDYPKDSQKQMEMKDRLISLLNDGYCMKIFKVQENNFYKTIYLKKDLKKDPIYELIYDTIYKNPRYIFHGNRIIKTNKYYEIKYDISTNESLIEYKNILILSEIFKGNENLLVYPENKNDILFWLYIPDSTDNVFEYHNKKNNSYERYRYYIPMILSKKCTSIHDEIEIINKGLDGIIKYKKDILESLNILHTQDYIHADFKIQNSVLCDDTYKLIDFGFLKKTCSGNKKLCGTYMLPFNSKFLNVDTKYRDFIDLFTPENINLRDAQSNLGKYNRNICTTLNIIDEYQGHYLWPFVMLSYMLFHNMFYSKYKYLITLQNLNTPTVQLINSFNCEDIKIIEKKTDEYPLALSLAYALLYIIEENAKQNKKIFNINTICLVLQDYCKGKDDINKPYGLDRKIYEELIDICKLLDPEFLNLQPIRVGATKGGRKRRNNKNV